MPSLENQATCIQREGGAAQRFPIPNSAPPRQSLLHDPTICTFYTIATPPPLGIRSYFGSTCVYETLYIHPCTCTCTLSHATEAGEPDADTQDCLYFAGNSLGLQPKCASQLVQARDEREGSI